MMEIFEAVKINTPNVVHETIDGEAILLNLRTGDYYSIDDIGALVWDYIEKTGNWQTAIELLGSTNNNQKELIGKSVQDFVSKLIKEELLIQDTETTKIHENGLAELEDLLKKAASDFKPPVVNKYSDMQDLLLLDPIHDVDEKGWPEPKEE